MASEKNRPEHTRTLDRLDALERRMEAYENHQGILIEEIEDRYPTLILRLSDSRLLPVDADLQKKLDRHNRKNKEDNGDN